MGLTRDQLEDIIRSASEGYFELLDDLNDTDTDDLAANIAASILTATEAGA